MRRSYLDRSRYYRTIRDYRNICPWTEPDFPKDTDGDLQIEEPQINNKIVSRLLDRKLQEAIAPIDEQRQAYLDELSSIDNEMMTIQQDNSLIANLPKDILLRIFLLASGPELISAVCQEWRRIMHMTCDAWSTIRIDLEGWTTDETAVQKIQAYLKLAGTLPFDTQVSLRRGPFLTQPLIGQLQHLLQRSVRLRLAFDGQSASGAKNITKYFGFQLQDVEILCLDELRDSYELPESMIKIKSLILRYTITQPPLTASYPTLRQLEVGHWWSNASFAWSSLASFLRATPSIETLVLINVSENRAGRSPRYHSLERLSSLRMVVMECEVMANILQDLAMPSLMSLALEYRPKCEAAYDQLRENVEHKLSGLGPWSTRREPRSDPYHNGKREYLIWTRGTDQ